MREGRGGEERGVGVGQHARDHTVCSAVLRLVRVPRNYDGDHCSTVDCVGPFDGLQCDGYCDVLNV